ncbi:hypothetical protein [Streptomyces sp. NPDC047315]
MPADCDCGACCEPCGHLDNCIRWALIGRRPDAADHPAPTTTTTTTGGPR